MKPQPLILAVTLAALLPGASLRAAEADLSKLIAEAARYESGGPVEPLRELERLVRDSAGRAALRLEVETALAKLLAPSSTFEARRFACVQLANLSTEASLPAILELLKHEDTTGIACLALGTHPSPKVNPALRSALATASGAARAQIIATLGNRRDAEAVKPLAEFARSADASLVAAAIGALGKIATPPALEELARLRQTGDPEQAAAAVRASLVAADRLAASDPKTAVSLYEPLLAGPSPASVRRAAFEGLLRLDKDDGEQRILEALRGKEALLKPSAIARVRALKSAEASATFAKEMARLEPAEQVLMIQSLAARNDAAARAAITEKVGASESAVARAAAVALATVGDASSVPVLAKALNAATNVEDQRTFEMALAGLPGGEAVDRAIAALLNEKLNVPRPALISVLARRGSPVAVPPLLNEADSTDPATAKAAFRALARLVTVESLPAFLEKLVKLKAPEARGAAEAALAQAVSRVPNPADRSGAVLEVLVNRAKTVDGKCAMIALLPACGDTRALEAVLNARTNAEPRIREAAVRALSEWPNNAAWDALSEIHRRPDSDSQRVLVLRALVRLAGEENAKPTASLVERYRALLDGAKTDEDRKLILGALSGCAHPDALPLALPLVSNPALKAEATAAVKKIADAIKAKHPQAAKEALEKLK